MSELADALAIALEAIEECAGDERYQAPELAARIASTRRELELLQLLLDETLN